MSRSLFHQLQKIGDDYPDTIPTIEMAINIISLFEKQESDDNYLIREYQKYVFDVLWFVDYLMNRDVDSLPNSDIKHAEYLMAQAQKLAQHNE
jgi:hypothetical protein